VLLSTRAFRSEVSASPSSCAGCQGVKATGPRRKPPHVHRGLHKQAASQGLVATPPGEPDQVDISRLRLYQAAGFAAAGPNRLARARPSGIPARLPQRPGEQQAKTTGCESSPGRAPGRLELAPASVIVLNKQHPTPHPQRQWVQNRPADAAQRPPRPLEDEAGQAIRGKTCWADPNFATAP